MNAHIHNVKVNFETLMLSCADDNAELQHKFVGFAIPIVRQAPIRRCVFTGWQV